MGTLQLEDSLTFVEIIFILLALLASAGCGVQLVTYAAEETPAFGFLLAALLVVFGFVPAAHGVLDEVHPQ